MVPQCEYSAVFEQVGSGWIGYAEELPGANAQGHTLEEVRENLKRVIQLILEYDRSAKPGGVPGRAVVRERLRVSGS